MIDSSLYASQGVKIDPGSTSSPDLIMVNYDGLLAQSGATEVFAHVGYDGWKEVRDYRMNRTDHGFEVSIVPPLDTDQVSLCFRDAASNWDNNSGLNYSFPLEQRDSYALYSPERHQRDASFQYWDTDSTDYRGFTAQSGELFNESWAANLSDSPLETSSTDDWTEVSQDAYGPYPEENAGRRSAYRSKKF